MSCECKFKGKCKDCNKKYPEGTTIDKNANDNWCPDGKNCIGCKPTPQPAPTTSAPTPQPAPEKAPTSDKFLDKRKDEIMTNEKKQNQLIQSLMKKHFTETQLKKLNVRMEKQMVLEYIADAKLSSASESPVNPSKTGMHTKFLADYMEKMLGAEHL